MVEYQKEKFIDETEITVEQWAEFVFDGNEMHKPELSLIDGFAYAPLFYPSEEPDSLYRAFGKIHYFELPVVTEYFDTLNYAELRNILDFPVSGISYQSALAYCDWRTKKYNEKLTDHTKQTIHFVLPDSVVLQPLQKLHFQNSKDRKEPKANFESSEYGSRRDATSKEVGANVGKQPVPVKSLPPNEFGVYGLLGNVAEMTAQKGIAYGGSYKTNSAIIQQIPYQQPESWLGFRCVGLVKDE